MADLKFPANFKVSDFACRCGCGGNAMDQAFLNRLGMMRTAYNGPMIITSGYRCKKYNETIKGAKNSQHCLGRAVDISCVEVDKRYKMVACAIQVGLSIGCDSAFLHVDSRPDAKIFFLYDNAKDA